jgi:hypothetical protein
MVSLIAAAFVLAVLTAIVVFVTTYALSAWSEHRQMTHPIRY